MGDERRGQRYAHLAALECPTPRVLKPRSRLSARTWCAHCGRRTADTTAPVPGGHAQSTGHTGGRPRLLTVRQHVEETR